MHTRQQDDIQYLWQDYERWLAEHWPAGLDLLQRGATDAQIAELEEVLQTRLPADLIACLKIHNGQRGFFSLLGGAEFLSIEEIGDQWQVWAELVDSGEFDDGESEPEAGIRSDWFNRKWIPFTHDGSGNHLCVDLDPAATGRHGQVITMWHDSAERELKAPDFHAFFKAYVEGVLSGQYVYSDEYGGIVEADDL